MIQMYVGNGKGKSTAAFGLAMRASAHDKKVCIIQFLKPGNSGEILSARKLGIEVYSFSKGGWVRDRVEIEDIKKAQEALELAKTKIRSLEYDLIILDEINLALFYKLISLEEVLEALESLPPNLELVLTGRYSNVELIEKADLVTEMREVKHYFYKGVQAREGIEY